MNIYKKLVFTAAVTTILVQPASAAVMVNFDYDGTDTTMSFVGDFDISGLNTNGTYGPVQQGNIGPTAMIVYDGNFSIYSSPAPYILPTLPVSTVATTLLGDSAGTFGYNANQVIVAAGTPVGNVTLNAASNFVIFRNASISDLGVDNVPQGTILYGTSTGETIVMGSVPEPSSTALLGLGGLALMLRRRR